MRTIKHKGKAENSLAYAVALQDHLSRVMQLPGGPKKLPSQAPGAAPTLAQRLGLLPQPDKLLTAEEWDQIHGMAKQRQESLTACAICLESFKAEQQVLLSCSHVFHAQCLKSFESHVRMKACPLCRKAWYQKMFISDSAEVYHHVCATRIQAAVRGWLCRKHLALQLLRHQPPTTTGLKRQWAAGRLGEAGTALSGLVNSAEDELEGLFAELNATLAASRGLADSVCARMQSTAAAAGHPAVASEEPTTTAEAGIDVIEQEGRLSGTRTSTLQWPCTLPPIKGGRSGHQSGGAGSSCHQAQHSQQANGRTSHRQTLRRTASSSNGNSTSGGRQAPLIGARIRNRNLGRSSSSLGTSRQAASRAPAAQASSSQRGRAADLPGQRNAHSRLPPAVAAGAAALAHAQQLGDSRTAAAAAAVAAASVAVAADTASPGALAAATVDVGVMLAVDWDKVVCRACQRAETECAICLGGLTGTQRETQGVALLSCSHVFHVQCVLSFERFEQARGGCQSCPVCRSLYARQCFGAETG